MEKIGLAAVLDMSDFNANMSKYDSALETMNKTTADAAGKVGQQFVGLGDAVNKAALVVATAFVAATAAAGAAFVKFTSDGISKAMDLEAQMGAIAAVMGVTKKEVEPLGDLIQNLALDPKLKVNTTEAADAIEMLGRNGLTMSEIMDGAARSTVLLANATEADFGMAADIATDVMSIFNIEAKDMNEAVDGITSVVNNSKFSIEDYAGAIAQGGGIAGAAGVSFDDMNTSLAATAYLFASGPDAGTSYKVFLQRLVPDTKDAADMMRSLGMYTGLTTEEFRDAEEKLAKYEEELAKIDPTSKNAAEKQGELESKIRVLKSSLVEGQNAFFHVDGSMRDMNEIAGVLQGALAGLSEEQQNQALKTLFGTDAMRTAVGLAKVGNDGFLELKATMGNTSAEDAAATRMDNFSGAMEILQGVIEAVQTGIGKKFLPVLQELAERLTVLVDQNREKIFTFFGGVAEWVGEKIPLAMDWLVQTGLPAMGQAFNYLTDTVFPGIAKAIAWATENWDFLSGAIKVLAGVLVTASLVSTFAGIVTAITPLITLITGAGGLVASMTGAGGIAAALVGLLNPVGLVVAAVGGLALAWATDFGGIRTGTIAQVTYIGGLLSTFGASIQTAIVTAIGNARTSWDTGWNNISARVSSAAGTIVSAVSTLGSSLQTAIVTAIGNARTSWDTGWNNISARVSSAAGTIVSAVSTLGSSLQTAIVTAIGNARTSWDTGWNNISARVSSAAGTISSAVSSLGGNVQGALNTAMNSALSSWGSAWENVRATISNKASAIATAARSAGSGAVDTLRSGWESGTGSFGMAVQRVAGSISGYFEEKSNHWLTAGRNVIAGVSSGISSGSSGLYAQMQTVAQTAIDRFKSALGIRSPSEVFAEAGYNISAGLAMGITQGQGLVSEAMARLESQTQLELNQYSAMVDSQLAATIARYQQGLAQEQAQDSIRQGFDQGQYAAYWAAIQAGESESSALATGQAVPRTPPSTESAGGGAAAAQAAAQAAAHSILAAQAAQMNAYNEAIRTAMTPLINTQVETLQAALAQVETAIGLVTERYDDQQFPLESNISTLERSIRDLESNIQFGAPTGAQRDANVAQLGSLQQELEIARIRLATLREARDESMTPLSDRKSEIEQQMAAAVNEAARSSGQRLLEEFTGMFSANRVTAALQEWQAAERIRHNALAAYQSSNGTNSTQTLQALLAANAQENEKRSALQTARDDVAANGTGWGGVQNRLRSFVGTTLGGAPTDVVATQLANPAANPGTVNSFIRTLSRLWETATGQVADEFNMLRPLIQDMATLVNATATTSVESLRDEFQRLIDFRNTVSPAYQNLTGTALGNVSNTENNFNVTFQGSSGANASVLQDIQFLNSLYATP